MFELRTRKDSKPYYPGRSTRKEKRLFYRQYGSSLATYKAYSCGEAAAYSSRPSRNPYPAGKRHDEWQRGYVMADPLGDHHGQNA